MLTPSVELTSVGDKLDLLIGLLRVAHREPLEQMRQRLLADPVSKAVLQLAAKGWIEAGTLKSSAAKKGRASKPTAERRIAELVTLGVLLRRGAGSSVRYRSSGLIEP
jgi:hypothetical protein